MKCTSIYIKPQELYDLFEDARKKDLIPLAYKYIDLIERINFGEKILRVDAQPIVWLHNPLKYSYLRKTGYTTTSIKFPEKKWQKNHVGDGMLIGYVMVAKNNCLFYWVVFWLKSYDRDFLPKDKVGGYAGPVGFYGHMPYEAVDPKSLWMVSDVKKITENYGKWV